MMKTWMGLCAPALVLLASATCSPRRPPSARPVESPAAIPFSAIAAAIPWRFAGISNVFPGREDARRPSALPFWRSQLQAAAGAGDETAAYLFAALDCAWPVLAPESAARASSLSSRSPAVVFARASCGVTDEATLRALVHAEPRFAEADFLLALGALRRREPDAAEARLRHVASLLPSLLAAPTTLGDLLSDAEDFEEALDFYDQALGFAPDHREALLGRARCLGNLNRNREALDTCDMMIRLGAWYLGPAYYWRAWNLHALKEIEPAWQAIGKSKQYIQNADVFELSGLIAFDRGDAAQARADMNEALRRNDRSCRPVFYLGLLDIDVEAWAGAAPRFVAAERCYDASAWAASERVEEVRRSAMPDARRGRVIERLRGQVAAARRAEALAAYQAAVSYAGTGQVAEALEHAVRALGDDAVRKQAEDLIARLKK